MSKGIYIKKRYQIFSKSSNGKNHNAFANKNRLKGYTVNYRNVG